MVTIVAVVVLGIGVWLGWVTLQSIQKLEALEAESNWTVVQLRQQAEAARSEARTWREQNVVIRGVVSCEQPLRAERTQTLCVHYKLRTLRDYLQSQFRGNFFSTLRESETISQSQRSVPFQVSDETGAIRVEPTGALIDTLQTADDFRPVEQDQDRTRSVFMRVVDLFLAGQQTLGYREIEQVLPLSEQVYVVGQAELRGEDLILTQPEDSAQPFVVSLRSKGQLLDQVRREALLQGITALVLLSVGGVMLVLPLL